MFEKNRAPALLILLITLTITSCSNSATEDTTVEVPPVPVVAEKPEIGTMTNWHRTTCEIQSPLDTDVAFPGGGRVIELVVEEGDMVSAGQYLGKVDTSTLAAQYQAIESSIEVAENQAVSAGLYADAAEAQVAQAMAAAEKAEADYWRFESLFTDGVATQSEFEQAELGYESAMLAVEAARDSADATRAQAVAAEAGVQATRDQRNQISEMIGDGTLRAPFSGRVVSRMVDPGAVAGPGQSIFRIIAEGDDSGNYFDIFLEIPELILGSVTEGSIMYLSFETCGVEVEVPIDHFSPEVRPIDRMVEIFAYLDRDSDCLLPGMLGIARIPLEVHENVIIVPEDAVIALEDVKLVYIAEGDIAVRREVETGLYEDGMVEILNGVDEMDDVIVVGNAFLADGATIDRHEETRGDGVVDNQEMEDES